MRTAGLIGGEWLLLADGGSPRAAAFWSISLGDQPVEPTVRRQRPTRALLRAEPATTLNHVERLAAASSTTPTTAVCRQRWAVELIETSRICDSCSDPGIAIDAYELRGGCQAGYRFEVIGEPDDDPPQLLGRLIGKLRPALALTHLEETEHGPQMNDRLTLRGTVHSDPDADHRVPMVVINGREISWNELGRIVATFEGWQFKLEFRDRSEELWPGRPGESQSKGLKRPPGPKRTNLHEKYDHPSDRSSNPNDCHRCQSAQTSPALRASMGSSCEGTEPAHGHAVRSTIRTRCIALDQTGRTMPTAVQLAARAASHAAAAVPQPAGCL